MDVTRKHITAVAICRAYEARRNNHSQHCRGDNNGASNGTRTRDLVLTKDVLYQLSYRGRVGAEDEGRTRDI